MPSILASFASIRPCLRLRTVTEGSLGLSRPRTRYRSLPSLGKARNSSTVSTFSWGEAATLTGSPRRRLELAAQPDRDVLRLVIGVEPFDAELASEARLLHAAEGALRG